MKVGIGNDHAATDMKFAVKKHLEEEGYEVIDYGTDEHSSVDYPDFAQKVCQGVLSGEVERGIAICGTGVGISIACNKIHGIRCAHASEVYSAEYSRRHNNANVIAFGARVIGEETAFQIVDVFLKAEFEDGGRHSIRVEKINALDDQYHKA